MTPGGFTLRDQEYQSHKHRASQLVGRLQQPLNCCWWSCYCVLYRGIHDSRIFKEPFNASKSSPESNPVRPYLHELSALPEAVYSGIFNCSSVSKSINEVEIPWNSKNWNHLTAKLMEKQAAMNLPYRANRAKEESSPVPLRRHGNHFDAKETQSGSINLSLQLLNWNGKN